MLSWRNGHRCCAIQSHFVFLDFYSGSKYVISHVLLFFITQYASFHLDTLTMFALISTQGRGYAATQAHGLAREYGGSYGGLGGYRCCQDPAMTTYGSPYMPADFGSGGGGYYGAGGGNISIFAGYEC